MRAGKEPPKPAGLEQALWFDLSPMRPDEWADTLAGPWLTAAGLRNAYMQGVEDARAEIR